MRYDVVDARHIREHVVWLQFRDGTCGEIDLGPELWGEIFEPLRDVDVFRQVQVHPEFETLVWPNGADFAPEFLYERLNMGTPPDAAGSPAPI